MKYEFGSIRDYKQPAILFSTTSLRGKSFVNLDKAPFLQQGKAEYVQIKDRSGLKLVCRAVVVLANAEDAGTRYYKVPLGIFKEVVE